MRLHPVAQENAMLFKKWWAMSISQTAALFLFTGRASARQRNPECIIRGAHVFVSRRAESTRDVRVAARRAAGAPPTPSSDLLAARRTHPRLDQYSRLTTRLHLRRKRFADTLRTRSSRQPPARGALLPPAGSQWSHRYP